MTERRTLAIGNQKGGVGKTTTALNLGSELVSRGRTVVLVDADPQHSLTTTLGVDAAERSLAEVLGDHQHGGLVLKDVIVKANGFWLIPSDIVLASNVLGILPTMTRRTKHHGRILRTLKESIEEGQIFDPIPQSIKASEAHAVGWPVARLDEDNAVAEAYKALAREVDREW